MRRGKNASLIRDDAEAVHNGFAQMLGTLEGRRALWWIFEQCNPLQSAFSEDDRKTNFLLGEKNVGLKLLARLEEVDPGAWLKLRVDQLEYMKQFNEENEDE